MNEQLAEGMIIITTFSGAHQAVNIVDSIGHIRCIRFNALRHRHLLPMLLFLLLFCR